MKLYNTLSRNIEKIEPGNGNRITMYSCGLTVYSQPHIGNWVAYIYIDVLFRVLTAAGYEVDRVQNITDVGHLVSDDDAGEDKMEKGARNEGITAWDVAEKYITVADHEGYELLGLLKPAKLIRATELISEQIEFIKQLQEKGYTYEIDNEGVYFDTSKFPNYGQLARLDIEGLQPGARVEVEGKRNPTDFAVWKFSPKDKQRDMEWDSPWGKGFPGWHLECSVIALHSLGEQIDIHTGGIDHIPVHHTNEIAQTEAVTGKQFVRYWFHNNHMKSSDAKMSKSLGNIYTLYDLLARGYELAAFKLMTLSSHYQTEGNFTWEILDAAASRLKHWREVADLIWQYNDTVNASHQKLDELTNAPDKLLAILENNLDTPGALKFIDEILSKNVSVDLDHNHSQKLRVFFEAIYSLLGINCVGEDITDEQKKLLNQRNEARVKKDWQESDRIRDLLLESNLGINDTKAGQKWFRLT